MKHGRRIAFDYGDVRVGVAMSDLSGLLASPHGVFSNDEMLMDRVRNLVLEYEPLYFAIGMPRHLSGNASAKMESVEEFINELNKNFRIDIVRIDERFTTVSAAKNLQASGKNARSAKQLIDAAAAATILEMALAMERNSEALRD